MQGNQPESVMMYQVRDLTVRFTLWSTLGSPKGRKPWEEVKKENGN